jgi:hypothetical protein
MNINASGRSALIVAAGLVVLLANPVTAATDADDSTPAAKSDSATVVSHRTVRHAWHHRRSYAHRRSHAIARKADDREADKKSVTADVAPANNQVSSSIPSSSIPSSSIPPSIANANAQMLLAGVQLSAAAAIPSGTEVPATTSDTPSRGTAEGGTFMVAADQLNDVDKTLQEGNSTPAPATTSSSQPGPAAPPSAVAATMTGESSIWDQTTLIGKIFIGFGALLTMASAARMFIT